jgi:hypothetical protein
LPRSLFHNDFEKLIDELEELDFILRAFSELATGSVETIEVHQISTSDPQFFFGLSPVTIAAIGTAITWALNTWKQVEDVRKVRAETRKLSAFSEKEVDDIFDRKIKSIMGTSIDAETKRLLADTGTRGGRVYEQGEHLKRALESILARVERGMTVEIRALPPPKGPEGNAAERLLLRRSRLWLRRCFFQNRTQIQFCPSLRLIGRSGTRQQNRSTKAVLAAEISRARNWRLSPSSRSGPGHRFVGSR